MKPVPPLFLLLLDNINNRTREYQAIVSMEQCSLKGTLLNPQRVPNRPSRVWSDLPPNFQAHLERCLNPSQFASVTAACKQLGVTLLQGPPGTGKTRTVHYLLNAIRVSQIQYRFSSLIQALFNSRKAWAAQAKRGASRASFSSDQASITTHRLSVSAP